MKKRILDEWRRAAVRAQWSGAAASLASAAVLAWRGARETGAPAAPINAVSHWLHGDKAARRNAATLRYTATGYLTHHAASVFWATVFERWIARRAWRGASPSLPAAGTAALAALIDYTITPHRFRPGYEKRLALRSLVLVYAAFGLGLALARPRAPHLPTRPGGAVPRSSLRLTA
jgi:hypothetical protein